MGMSFRPRMTSRAEGLELRPSCGSRVLDGMAADLWQGRASDGGGGYFLSPDARIVVFLGAEPPRIRLAESPAELSRDAQEMRALYVPAGIPLWSRVTGKTELPHLDLHFDADVLRARLAARLGSSPAGVMLERPVRLGEDATVGALANLLAQELRQPALPDLYAESLIIAIAAAILPLAAPAPPGGRLTSAQLRRLRAFAEAALHRRLATAELAAALDLSESWFSRAFRQSCKTTPQRWLMGLRVARVKEMLAQPGLPLAEIAEAAGFADQAHLTRVFRAHAGTTPAAWRRAHFAG